MRDECQRNLNNQTMPNAIDINGTPSASVKRPNSMLSFSVDANPQINPSKGLQEGHGQSFVNEDELIEMYLNQQVFYQSSLQRSSSKAHSEHQHNLSKSQNTQIQVDQTHNVLQIQAKQRKSIFHNFQKHLITMVKKYLCITKNMVSYCPHGLIAFELWQAFMKTTSFNKRLLQAVFGVQEEKSRKVTIESREAEFPEIQRLKAKYGPERFSQAQSIIRQCVIHQAMHLNRFLLRSNSNITKFDEFYAYFENFINEIKVGPLSKRMKKSSKQIFVKTFKNEQ